MMLITDGQGNYVDWQDASPIPATYRNATAQEIANLQPNVQKQLEATNEQIGLLAEVVLIALVKQFPAIRAQFPAPVLALINQRQTIRGQATI